MIDRRNAGSVALALALAAVRPIAAEPPAQDKPLPSIAEKTRAMRKHDGFLPFYDDEPRGKLWLEIGRPGEELLLVDSLPAGLGSNDIGLDRGQYGRCRVVRFERAGPKVLLIQENYGFRAGSGDADERRAVADAFARSTLWGFEAAAEEDGRVLVDATAFVLGDAHDVVGVLKRAGEGTFRQDPSRSAIDPARSRNFPRNTEIETLVTFLSDDPGPRVREVAPDPRAITVREHLSFIRLPDGDFRPREFDARAGFFGIDYMDFAAPPGEAVVKRLISRHRLRRKDPSAPSGEPVAPIVYYVDPAIPEPIRSAVLEGARWWSQAFETAGYRNAFRVEMLPPGVDPMDIRYNVIEWIHRSTRGWAYGEAVVDPRTGEILNGHVSLDSLRWRQDYQILEGLLSPHAAGGGVAPDLMKTVLARMRQLAAHEVGHTLGLAHNYVASAAGRASVMDYPHPRIALARDGSLDLTDAYASGIGAWDRVSIAYGYSDFPPGTDGRRALEGILEDARRRGLTFLTDQDARPAGSAHPLAHLWDNGANAVDELGRVLAVRARALERFSEAAVPDGTPLALLGDALVPVYFYHRYQTEAATKVIGGLTYTYAVRGDGQVPTEPVPAADQRRALDAVLATLAPEVLDVGPRIAALIPPRPAGYEATRESFAGRTGPVFDALGAAEAAAQQTLSVLLDPARAARLAQFHALDPGQPGLGEVLDRIVGATWKLSPPTPRARAFARTAADVALVRMIALAQDERVPAEVREITRLALHDLGEWAARQAVAASDPEAKAHLGAAAEEVRALEARAAGAAKAVAPLVPPPGQPIGGAEEADFGIPSLR